MNKKLEAVNSVLEAIAPGTWVEKGSNGWIVSWKNGSHTLSRRWQTIKGNDHYPVWHHSWGHGGTCCTALSQLMRWLQNRPVFPIGTWKYWTGPTVLLGRGSGEIVSTLEAAGYPDEAICVVCGESILSGLDWCSLNNVSGPCHLFGRCQKERSA
jgi:hypothetical protein